MKKNFIFIILIIMLATLIALLDKHFPRILDQNQNKISLLISFIILTSFISKIIHSELKLAIVIKQLIGWVTICLVILTGYSYQYEIKQLGNRLSANLIPGYAQGNKDGSVTFYSGGNGHFSITALINDNQKIHFLFDTGASLVSLTAEDAADLGIDLAQLNFNFPLSTANGLSFGARVNIAKVQIGPVIVNNVEAVVSKPGASDISLLGMSFLNRLKQFIIKGNTLTLVN